MPNSCILRISRIRILLAEFLCSLFVQTAFLGKHSRFLGAAVRKYLEAAFYRVLEQTADLLLGNQHRGVLRMVS